MSIMYYLGVDLGGTNIAAGLVNHEGELLVKKSIPTLRHRSAEEIFTDLAKLCISIAEEAKVPIEKINSIGIGSPGTCDNEKGIILYANNLNFENVPVRELVQKHINLPVWIDNDANCAALGESTAGAAKGFKNSITITLGTGLGGGIVLDGKIFSGSFFGGGEVGHHVIVVNGEECTCGRKGCWEAYSSATALIREAKIAAATHPDCLINQLVNGDVRLIDAKIPFDAMHQGDEVAKKIIETYIQYLAEGLANIINILQPEVVVIGGGVCAQKDELLRPLKKETFKLVYGIGADKSKTQLKIALLENDAGIIGAAMLGL